MWKAYPLNGDSVEITTTESEFNKFKPRLKSAQNKFLIERLKSLNIEYNFKWNQPYLSRALNSLNSASGTLS